MKSAAGDDNKKEGIWSSLSRALGCQSSKKASINVPLQHMLSEAEKAELAVLLRDHNNDIEGILGRITPLIAAVEEGNIQTVTLLIKAGVDVKVNLPLCIASQYENSTIIESLIAAKADIEKGNFSGTPLANAAKWNNVDAVATLFAHKATINSPSNTRCSLYHRRAMKRATALGIASSEGHIEVVQLLLNERADPDLPIDDREGTPLHLASERGHQHIVKLLLLHGAGRNSATQILHYTICICVVHKDLCYREVVMLLLASPYVDYQALCQEDFREEYDSCEEAILKSRDPIIIAVLNKRKRRDLGNELEGFLNEPALVSQYKTSILAQLLGIGE